MITERRAQLPIKLCKGKTKWMVIIVSLVIPLLTSGWASGQWLHMERPSLGAGLSFEHEIDKRKGPDITRTDKTTTYNERLDIETSGWVYHPALVVYTLTMSPEWEQISDKSEGSDKQESRSFLQGYSGELVFLQYKPYTLRLFAGKSMNTIHSNYAERTRTESENFGATLYLKYDILPATLSYTHFEDRQRGFFDTDNEGDRTTLRMRYKKMGGDTRINAEYIENKHTVASSTSTENTVSSARFQNFYRLPENKDFIINSFFNAREIKTNFSRERTLTWSEVLNLKHRENLSTTYKLKIENVGYEDSRSRLSKSASFGLSHTLYENLITTVRFAGGQSEFEDEGEDTYSTGLDWNYRRVIPGGKIFVNIGHTYRVFDTRYVSELAEVTNESIVLRDGSISLLFHEFVDTSTIVVTDATGSITYVNGIDYTISSIGTFTRLIRLAIPNGTTVLVDYKYQSDPAYDYSIFTQSYGVSLNLWQAVRLSYRFNRSKQRVLRGTKQDGPSENIQHSADAELKWRWTVSRFDYLKRDSTELPLERMRFTETMTFRPRKNFFVSASGVIGTTKFTKTDDIEHFRGLRSRIQSVFLNNSRVSLEGFINETSGSTINTSDSGVDATYEWKYRIYSGKFLYEFSERRDKDSGELQRNNLFLVTVERELF
jgi:hypothetical protein